MEFKQLHPLREQGFSPLIKDESCLEKTILANKPHAVVIPCPFQSHIKAMLKLAKLLHYKGFHITYVNTQFNHNRLLKSGGPNSLDGLPDFRFETIPDGLPPSDPNTSQDIGSLFRAVLDNFLSPFVNLVSNKLNVSSDIPPVTCIVSDGFVPFTIEAGKQLELRVLMAYTMSACGVLAFKQLHGLREKGFSPLKDEGCLEKTIDWVPSMKDIKLKDLPFVRSTDIDDITFNFTMEGVETAVQAPAVLLHTLDVLEPNCLRDLSSIYARVYTVGPFQLHLNQIQDDSLKSVGYSLWKEDTECVHWLDTKEPNSVVYVNFGSTTSMTKEQLVEFGIGLVNSKIPFLWIIRPDVVIGDSAILPPEIAREAKNHGFITSWCPQEEVLNHPSVGGFLTHCGWGSTIESLAAGVPMLCWPFFGDQPMNCRFSCNEWGVGMEMNNNVKREEVEKLVKELVGEKGKEMREKAMEWKRLAEEATSPNGPSSINLNKVIDEVLL